jgi:hypothetical protein
MKYALLVALFSCAAPVPAFPPVTEATCFERSFHFLSPEAERLYFWSITSGTVRVYHYVEGAAPGDPLFEVEALTCVEAKSFVCTDLEMLLEQSLGCP